MIEPMTREELLAFINGTPAVLSLLYDMGLLPEQLKEGSHGWFQMRILCEHLREVISTASLQSQPSSAEAFRWMVTRPESEVDGPEYFDTEALAINNARKGMVTAHITPLYSRPSSPGCVEVPESALKWLFGEEGEFECPPEKYFRGKPPAYWWRSVFREKLSAAPASPAENGKLSTDQETQVFEIAKYVNCPADMARRFIGALGMCGYALKRIEAVQHGGSPESLTDSQESPTTERAVTASPSVQSERIAPQTERPLFIDEIKMCRAWIDSFAKGTLWAHGPALCDMALSAAKERGDGR